MPWYDTQGKIETIVPGLQSRNSDGPAGLGGSGDPAFRAHSLQHGITTFLHGLACLLAGIYRRNVGQDFWCPGKTSIRASYGIYYTSIEDLNLFYESEMLPWAVLGFAEPGQLRPTFQEIANGSSETQRFPFVLPKPGPVQ